MLVPASTSLNLHSIVELAPQPYTHTHIHTGSTLCVLTGIQIDPKDVAIPADVCQMIERVLQDLSITPVMQVSYSMVVTVRILGIIFLTQKKYWPETSLTMPSWVPWQYWLHVGKNQAQKCLQYDLKCLR